MRFSVLLKRRCALDGVVGRSSEVMMRAELTMQHDGNNTIIIIMILSVTTFVQHTALLGGNPLWSYYIQNTFAFVEPYLCTEATHQFSN